MIGKTIFHYKIIEQVGQGGMGEVYLAEDTKLKRNVALKFLPQHLTADKEAKERFEREAQAAAALNHPNIITIYEIGEHEGQTYIAMEFVAGKTLRQLLIDNSQLTIENCLEIITQICEGLAKAHQAGIVHRDIKPENILIDNDGRVKILDFGLAKLKGLGNITKDTSTLGTVNYMSPEQARGEKIDHRTDIWSLGVVLYELLTGELPFKGDYEQAVIYSILNEEPQPLSEPKYVNDLVMKCLQKSKNERYQQINDIRSDLDSIRDKSKMNNTLKESKQLKSFRKKYVFLTALIVLIVSSLFLIKNYFFSTDHEKIINSIAVLPLQNLSGDKEQEYFADGMTEAIISELAKIKALKIISRTSVMRYKNTEKSIPEIADALHVDAIVEGSVLRADNKVRITTQLIEANVDRHLWVKNYERNLQDVLKLQRNVAQDIADEIRINLSTQERTLLSEAQSVIPEAHEAYLKGLYYWNKRTAESLKKSIVYYNQAIDIESNYAMAYAGLAQTYIVLGAWGFLPLKETDQKAKEFAQKSLKINNDLAEAHTALAAVLEGAWKWKEAIDEYERAILLSPNYATAHQWYAEYLTALGKHKQAFKEMEKALELDPLSLIINHNFGLIYYLAHEYDRAIDQFNKTLELEENFGGALYFIYLCYLEKGMPEKAVKKYQEMLSANPNLNHLVDTVGHVYEESGINGFLQWLIDNLDNLSNRPYNNPYYLAVNYARLGESDEAFKWLEVLYKERIPRIRYLKVDPGFDNIRSDPRFNVLLNKLGFEN